MQDDCETVKKIFTVIIGDSYNASQWLPVFKKEKKTYTENTKWIPLWSETTWFFSVNWFFRTVWFNELIQFTSLFT